MNGTDTATIQSSLKECTSHIEKIERSKKLLQDTFPLSVEQFEKLNEEKIEHIDQLIYRFIKLQDSMGTRLFPSLYSHIEKDDTPKPFLSILRRLEQLSVLSSADDWQFFRNLRNNLAHDYPESVRQTVDTLNTLYNKLHSFEEMFQKAKQYWESLPSDA